MGEMADYAIDDMFEHEDHIARYRQGQMDILEAHEKGVVDELGYDIKTYTISKHVTKTCRNCNKSGLHWRKIDNKWRLHEEQEIHKCPIIPLKDD